ncbi:Solute carrier family 35 member F6 [Trichostrongylus colubriformis]|uniref:Solute carrier family 35 member F6 n=1 Tax=Trichostrongylus colubriformis TaxID=6319 RepID=A0AAN8IP23_TRICO
MTESSGRAFALTISILMVVTGSLNTICAKWADSLKAEGVPFNHPFLQATCMFFGEFLCLVAFFVIYGYRKHRWNAANISGESGSITDITSDSEPQLPQFNPFVFLPPACCDILATSIMYIGLNLTTASSFQMLRGAVIVFTGLLSVGMLGARIQVGVTDIYYDDDPLDDKNAIITGNLLIIMAQIIVAIQMVYEQKYLNQYDVPALFAVGLEGLFGMTILSLLMVPMTLLIWAFSIPFFGEQFIPLQLIGFGLLILGMFVYNDILIGPWFRRRVLPNMGDSNVCTRCWFSICGADLIEADRESLLNEDA